MCDIHAYYGFVVNSRHVCHARGHLKNPIISMEWHNDMILHISLLSQQPVNILVWIDRQMIRFLFPNVFGGICMQSYTAYLCTITFTVDGLRRFHYDYIILAAFEIEYWELCNATDVFAKLTRWIHLITIRQNQEWTESICS